MFQRRLNWDQPRSWSTGVSMQDVNNDGYLDIHVCKVGAFNLLKGYNQLYINNGDYIYRILQKNGCGFFRILNSGSILIMIKMEI